jgi:hypothetical protein
VVCVVDESRSQDVRGKAVAQVMSWIG